MSDCNYRDNGAVSVVTAETGVAATAGPVQNGSGNVSCQAQSLSIYVISFLVSLHFVPILFLFVLI
jgi:hypothetical protein